MSAKSMIRTSVLLACSRCRRPAYWCNDPRGDRPHIQHVQPRHQNAALLGEFGLALGRAHGGDDVLAFGLEAPGGRLADAAGRACDQEGLLHDHGSPLTVTLGSASGLGYGRRRQLPIRLRQGVVPAVIDRPIGATS